MSWSSSDRDLLKRLYGKVSAVDIARVLGKSENAVVCKAMRDGLGRRLGDTMRIRECGDVCFVPLHSKKHAGLFARISSSKLHLVKGHRWSPLINKHGNCYARARINGVDQRMHRIIMNAPPGMDVDHKDGNGLNNTDANLRLATKAQNNANQKRRGSGMYKGALVSNGRFRARIGKKHLGMFDTEIEAAQEYDRAAREKYGEFASLNFPDAETGT